MRWIAALLVVLGHVRVQILEAAAQISSDAILPKAIVFFSGFGRGAVILFFVISGYLVGGGLLSKTRDGSTLKRYAIDRLTRLYVVLIPVLALTWILAYWQCRTAYDCDWQQEQWSLETLFGNVIFQQGIRFQNWGGNYPLWSLANEFLYYLSFPLILLVAENRRYRLLAAALLAASFYLMGLQVLILFPVWLLGVAARHWPVKLLPGKIALLGLVFVMCLKRIYPESAFGLVLDYAIGIVFTMWITAIANDKKQFPDGGCLRAFDKWAADWSFTLYAAHLPVLVFILWLTTMRAGPLGLDADVMQTWFVYLTGLIGTLFVCYLLSLLTERHTAKVRKLLIPTPAGFK